MAALVLCACARNQVAPVRLEAKEICIIENPRVRSSFLEAYRKALEDRGFTAAVVLPTSAVDVCPVTTKYVAYWRWDLVLYMAQAQLDVYKDGKPAGRAIFHARQSRLISAEGKVRELVDQLFPL
jgi:ribosome modulation factor